MERETGAWDWAKANALAWTPRMERARALAEYEARHKKIDAKLAGERAEMALEAVGVEFSLD